MVMFHFANCERLLEGVPIDWIYGFASCISSGDVSEPTRRWEWSKIMSNPALRCSDMSDNRHVMWWWFLPSGELTVCNGKSTMLLMGKYTISMAIFNSYVSSREGNHHINHHGMVFSSFKSHERSWKCATLGKKHPPTLVVAGFHLHGLNKRRLWQVGSCLARDSWASCDKLCGKEQKSHRSRNHYHEIDW